jgi:Putative Ig domain
MKASARIVWGGSLKMRARAVIGISLALGAGAVEAATQAQINAARDKAAAWLIGQQLGEGRWTTGHDADIPVTAQALMGLTAAGVKGIPARNATSWLLNAKADSIDALARSLLALTSPNASQNAGFGTLVSWANGDYGTNYMFWGSYPGYATSVPDSALAWRSILAVGYALNNRTALLGNSMCQLFLSQQRADGSWTLVAAPQTGTAPTPAAASAGTVFATTQMMVMLKAAQAKEPSLQLYACGGSSSSISASIDTAVNAAATWLTGSVKNADGGIGEGGQSNLIATAQAYYALQLVRPTDPATGSLLDYLLAKQAANGSWSADPMLTGQVLEALGRVASATVDADGDGIPDSIEIALGLNPAVADPAGVSNKSNGVGQPGINLPLTLANRVVVNVPYSSGVLSISGGAPPYTWSLASGVLPPGLVLGAGTGIISGTPTALGTYNFEYAARDTGGATARVVGQITVVRAAPGTGDINGDGRVDLADVILAQRIALGLMTPTAQQKAAADVAPLGDPDGVIDASDVALILRKALGIDAY